MSILHSAIQHADCHEPRHITTAGIVDAGKVITPSSSVAGTSVLRKLVVADIDAADPIVLIAAVQTLTNKRVTPRISVVAFSASIDVNSDNFDVLACDSLSNNITVNNPTGTPTDGQLLVVRLTQDGVGGRTVTWGAGYAVVTAISATASKSTTWNLRWHSARSLWVETVAGA